MKKTISNILLVLAIISAIISAYFIWSKGLHDKTPIYFFLTSCTLLFVRSIVNLIFDKRKS